ncbi:MAG: MurR/RpiR family transcriptional regulator [Lachnospiraceae bacterium]|nr:MurR/RpiR family transcriptional regulator [Lachnospiraceae bacterium]MBR3736642.1 MurR/RpiR family transcriptional regulator [Lachnospiraceae bacterium]MBR6157459.1 MurR/RpiR family transcriptional regulator [Lachnospiraceae bacterium]
MLDVIKAQYDKMSKGQKKIADYISENMERAAFMTAMKLAEAAAVSESTVVRFATMLGYDGYPEFQQAMADELQGRLVSPKKANTNEFRENRSELLRRVLVSDAQNIVDTIGMVDSDVFDQAVELVSNARKICVVGIRTCAPLADYLTYYLRMMRDDVVSVTTTNISEIYEQLSWLKKEDVVIGISFPRYSLRTLRAMDYANHQGARIISVTDSKYSPMNMYSSVCLWAKTDMITIADSLVAPMSTINALVIGVYLKNEEQIRKRLEALEESWNAFQTYDRDEMSDIGE